MPTRSSNIDGKWTARREADWNLFHRSEAFQRILSVRPQIEAALRARPMKVLPTRYVARLFEISERLLWKWIEQKVLSTRRRPSKHPEHHKKGITLRVIQEFLRRLGWCGEMRAWIDEGSDRPRRQTKTRHAPARAKCQEGKGLLEKWTPTPREYAEAVGVSVSTVYRMLRDGRLSSFRPTKKRIALCHFFHKNRNKLLTRKTRGKCRKSVAEAPRSPCSVFNGAEYFYKPFSSNETVLGMAIMAEWSK